MGRFSFSNMLLSLFALALIGYGVYVGAESGFFRNDGEVPIAVTSYRCNDHKTIEASFFSGAPAKPTAPDAPPVPTGHVELSLSDGRTLTLSRTISADGIRYSDGDPSVLGGESFVFWSKGNGAFALEHNEEKSYLGCIAIAANPGTLPQVYENGAQGFSIRYPAGYTVDDSYQYQALGPKKAISGIRFTIDSAIATGTNLGSDSYFSVEQIPQIADCSAALFLERKTPVMVVNDNDVDYSFASSTGAAAGNHYEELVYAIPGTNPCVAVRYFVHSSVLENYPAGTVAAFDEGALRTTFDTMRRTLILQKP